MHRRCHNATNNNRYARLNMLDIFQHTAEKGYLQLPCYNIWQSFTLNITVVFSGQCIFLPMSFTLLSPSLNYNLTCLRSPFEQNSMHINGSLERKTARSGGTAIAFTTFRWFKRCIISTSLDHLSLCFSVKRASVPVLHFLSAENWNTQIHHKIMQNEMHFKYMIY